MNREELDIILKDHQAWLCDEGGHRANLQGADLSGADLKGAVLKGAYLQRAYLKGADLKGADLREADLRRTNLTGADLSGVYLREADLQGADLKKADLKWADLQWADLQEADLKGAYLKGADLKGADLKGADLKGADLREADLRRADLSDVITNEHTAGYHLQCPEKGSFTAYKKCIDEKEKPLIVELIIPKDAKRSSATSRKCRASKAIVDSIEDADGNPHEIAYSMYDKEFIYEVGETVSVGDFNEDRWNECSAGIHFFMTKQEAINY